MNSWRVGFWILFVAYSVLLLLVFRAVIAGHPDGIISENYYYPWGRDIAAKGWDGFAALIRGDVPDPWGYLSFRPPLYPLVLAAMIGTLGDVPAYGIVLNYLFLVAAVVLTHCIGNRISPLAGLIAPLLVMLDPLFITAASSNQSELIFVVCMLGCSYACILYFQEGGMWRQFIVVLLFWVVAVYIRAAALYMWLPLLMAIFYHEIRNHGWGRALRRSAIIVVVAAASIGMWKWRNNVVTGDANFGGRSGGVHLVGYYLPQIMARENGTSFKQEKARIASEIDSEIKSTELSEKEISSRLMNYAIGGIQEHPVSAVIVALNNIPKMLLSFSFEIFNTLDIGNASSSDSVELRQSEEKRLYDKNVFNLADKWRLFEAYIGARGYLLTIYAIFIKALNGLAFLMGVYGVILMMRSGDRNHKSIGVYFFLWVGLMIAMTSLVAAARFRLPISPLIFVCAAFAWPHAMGMLRSVIPAVTRKSGAKA